MPTPVRDPAPFWLLFVVLPGTADRGAAAPARTSRAIENPRGAAGSGITGGYVAIPVTVGHQ
ncbi:MAG: hypothetical protein ACRDV3_10885 [Acidothermaceae bacterium]